MVLSAPKLEWVLALGQFGPSGPPLALVGLPGTHDLANSPRIFRDHGEVLPWSGLSNEDVVFCTLSETYLRDEA